MEGKLIKWTNYFSGWKERIFIIKGPLLYYYYALKELPRGKVHLGLATIINDENNDYFEINTGSNIFFLKAENKEMREKWVNALTKAKLEGEKNIREILKKNKTTKNPEYNDLIYPELNYDAELEQLYTAVTRLKIDNQNLMNYIESKNFKDPEFKILKERFQDDFEILQTCVKLFDPIDDKSGNNSKNLNLVNQNKILRNSSWKNFMIWKKKPMILKIISKIIIIINIKILSKFLKIIIILIILLVLIVIIMITREIIKIVILIIIISKTLQLILQII